MTRFDLFMRNMAYYRRQAAALFLGAVLVALVISTALFLGDSVQWTLRQQVERRLAGLRSVAQWSGVHAAPDAILQARGFVQLPDGPSRAIQLFGLDDQELGLEDHDAMANQAILDFLGENASAELHIRLQTMPEIAVESMPGRPGRIRQLRLRLKGLLPTPLRDFSLVDSQAAPLNLFLKRSFLAAQLEVRDGGTMAVSPLSAESFQRQLQDALTPDDIGIHVVPMGERLVLKSREYFLPPYLHAAFPEAQPVLSWFFAELTDDNARLQYSFLAGVPDGLMAIPADECWLSDSLGLQPGAGPATLRYYQVGAFREIRIAEAPLTRLRLVDDHDLSSAITAAIPGLTDASSCAHWDAPLPVDMKRIQEADELYWRQHGAKPKAYLALRRAQALFGDGALTALVFPAGTSEAALRERLDELLADQPGLLQCWEPREGAMANAVDGVDFAALFLGLSSLVVVAALLVLALLLGLQLMERRGEFELFAALGFPALWLRRELALELGVLMVVGAAAGVLLGMPATAGLLGLLGWVWGDAYGLSRMLWRCEAFSAMLAYGAAVLLGLGALFVMLRRDGRTGFWRRRWPRPPAGITALSWRTVCRQQSRSRLLVALLVLGLTLTLAVGTNAIRTRGEGGFGYEWVVSTALPYTGVLSGQANGAVLPIRVHQASPADCSNLSRVTTPTAFGVDLAALGGTAIPLSDQGAAVDRAVLQWILKGKLGDQVHYERGAVTLEHAFAGSVFQGGVVLSQHTFQRLFPNDSGAAMWLLRSQDDAQALATELVEYGVSVERVRERMDRFDALQNRYLLMFLALGVLALLLGVGAMALALARSMAERRREIVLLAEIGFTNGRIAAIFILEQVLLLAVSVFISLLLLGGLAVFTALSMRLVFLVLGLLLPLWALAIALDVQVVVCRMTSCWCSH